MLQSKGTEHSPEKKFKDKSYNKGLVRLVEKPAGFG
jgi:hypothetical protein